MDNNEYDKKYVYEISPVDDDGNSLEEPTEILLDAPLIFFPMEYLGRELEYFEECENEIQEYIKKFMGLLEENEVRLEEISQLRKSTYKMWKSTRKHINHINGELKKARTDLEDLLIAKEDYIKCINESESEQLKQGD